MQRIGQRLLVIVRVGLIVVAGGLAARWPAAGGADRFIAHVADRADQRFVLRSEFGAQPSYVHVDRAGATEEVVSPYLVQQLRAGEHSTGVLRQVLQQLELFVGQVKWASTQSGGIGALVDHEFAEADLADDWKAVHEMTHLALPDVDEPHLWLAEGIAVYVEPIARVQAGDLTAEKIWGDMVRDMKQGLPKQGDRGLDHTPTWGRTYWGAAIFCLLADVEIRKRTGNKIGLQQALRGILDAGGNHEQDWQDWPVERIFRVADKATGVTVLSELYEKMRAKPYSPDLDALWREFGISVRDSQVTFDDSAPLAPVRRAITTVPSL